MTAYLLLFRGGNNEALQQSPEQWQAHMQQWMEWMSALHEQGKFAGAQPLKPEGKVVRGCNKLVTDGPFMEGNEIVSGYLICNAASYEEAIEISKGCPVLLSDSGIVEIREIQDMQI